jgi:type II secretory pathway predicted ATPase ExeA/septal ring-binding cell division protein DamX
MYYEHFGLTQAPFKITPNTEFFFSGGNRGPVLEALIYAITRGEGIVKVTGEVGSGKTMLCNMLQSRLPDHVESVYLANPSVAPEEVLHAIAFDLQLGLDRQADRLEVTHALQDYLVRHHAEGKRVVVFIEESQSMPLATLEEIRLLSNLETRNDKLMQIVLFGQPELDETLRRPDIRQLRDRIAHSFRLQPLNDAEVRDYLMFRMRAAGYRGPEIFTGPVVKRIARASSGLTRRINLIADKALLAAFSENTHTLRTRHVQAALRDSEFGPMEPPWKASQPAFGWAALMLIVGLGLGAALYALLDKRSATSVAAAASPAAPAAVPNASSPSANAAAGPPPPQAPPNPAPVAHSEASSAPTAAAPAAAAVAQSGTAAVPDQPQAVTVARARIAAAPRVEAAYTVDVAPVAAPAPAAPPPAAAIATAGDLIADRIDATEQWVNSKVAGPYSIQLFVAADGPHLRDHLKSLPKSVEINDIYMYRWSAQGRPMVNVLWRSFSDRKAAQDEAAVLPASLKANRPYVRALDEIRAEIDRQKDFGRR